MKTLVSPGNFHVLSKFFFRARDLHTFLAQYGCHLELYKGRNVDNLSILDNTLMRAHSELDVQALF